MSRRTLEVVKGERYARRNTSLRTGASLGRKERRVMGGVPQRHFCKWPHLKKRKKITEFTGSPVVRTTASTVGGWGGGMCQSLV